jgi:hypothetical protein
MSRGLRDGGFGFQHAPTRQPISSGTPAGVLVRRPSNPELSPVPGRSPATGASVVAMTVSQASLMYDERPTRPVHGLPPQKGYDAELLESMSNCVVPIDDLCCDPSSADCVRATFSHKGRRQDASLCLNKNLTRILLICPSCQCVAAVKLDRKGKSASHLTPSHPTRGALRTSRNARWDAVDVEFAKDERKRSRTAKSCGPDAPVAGVKFVMMLRITRATVANKPGLAGESTI